MKKIMTLLAAMVGVLGQAYADETVVTASTADMLRDGMTWETIDYPGVSDPNHIFPDTSVYYYIDGTEERDGKEYALLYRFSIYDHLTQRYGLRCEGDKVYARFMEREGDDEFLAYDFSLQPGEGNYITLMYHGYCANPYRTYYVKCVSREIKTVCGIQYEFLHLETYENEYSTRPLHPAQRPFYWIKGIGNKYGVIDQIELNMLGGGEELNMAFYYPDVIYTRDEAEKAAVHSTVSEGPMPTVVYGIDGLSAPSMKGVRISNGKKYIDKAD